MQCILFCHKVSVKFVRIFHKLRLNQCITASHMIHHSESLVKYPVDGRICFPGSVFSSSRLEVENANQSKTYLKTAGKDILRYPDCL